MVATYSPDALIVVMAVDDFSSMELAEQLLSFLTLDLVLKDKPIILVANKSDLVRSREIRTSEGKALATKYSVKYIETSPGKAKWKNIDSNERLLNSLPQVELIHR